MMLNDITRTAGAHKRRKRVGRGEGSGLGKTCGRGYKGAQSRSGAGGLTLFEGGAAPLFRHIPKRGFSNFNFRTAYAVVNLSELESSFNAGDRVNPAALHVRGLAHDNRPLKVLGAGTISKNLTVEAHAFSRSAREAIEKAGGSVVLIPARDPAARAAAKRKTSRPGGRTAGPTRLEKKKAARAS